MLLQLCEKQMLVQMEGKRRKKKKRERKKLCKQKRHLLCGYSELNQFLLHVGL